MSTWGFVKPRLGDPKGSSPTRHCHLRRTLHRHTPCAVRCRQRETLRVFTRLRNCHRLRSREAYISLFCWLIGVEEHLGLRDFQIVVQGARDAQSHHTDWRPSRSWRKAGSIAIGFHRIPSDAIGCLVQGHRHNGHWLINSWTRRCCLAKLGGLNFFCWKGMVLLCAIAVSDHSHSHHSDLWARPLPLQGVKP